MYPHATASHFKKALTESAGKRGKSPAGALRRREKKKASKISIVKESPRDFENAMICRIGIFPSNSGAARRAAPNFKRPSGS
jgi:hypothetical protein